MSRDPIARAIDIVLARWNPQGLAGAELKLAGARCPVIITGYSPHGRNVHFKTPADQHRGWMNAREFVRRLP